MKKRILVGISGSSAAFKVPALLEQLAELYTLDVIMTSSSEAFVTTRAIELTSKSKVHSDKRLVSGADIEHIELAKQADLILIVPATANVIAKIAAGIGDDLLTTALTVETGVPKLFAPAMNHQMYDNPIVQRNIDTLVSFNWTEIKPQIGILSSGEEGMGVLAAGEDIMKIISKFL